MAKYPQEGKQRIIPFLAYADAPAAIEFLCKAYGFVEEYRLMMPDGRVGHAELALDTSKISLASLWEELGFASPKDLGRVHAQLLCYVDDVDAHYERAKAAGATILDVPADQFHGDRIYRTVDPEGHRWIFATQVREVSLEEMQRAVNQ
jgi:PhnB protein